MEVSSPEFELTICRVTGPDEIVIRGFVTSQALDGSMHPRNRISVYILSKRSSGGRKKGLVLDSFQLESLVEYLRLQEYVRETLERELPRDQEEVDPDGEPVRGDVWSWARVRELELRLRDLHNPQTFKHLKEAGLNAEAHERELPAAEKPETRTLFVIRLECDWSPDHTLEATFRDGKFVNLQ